MLHLTVSVCDVFLNFINFRPLRFRELLPTSGTKEDRVWRATTTARDSCHIRGGKKDSSFCSACTLRCVKNELIVMRAPNTYYYYVYIYRVPPNVTSERDELLKRGVRDLQWRIAPQRCHNIYVRHVCKTFDLSTRIICQTYVYRVVPDTRCFAQRDVMLKIFDFFFFLSFL